MNTDKKMNTNMQQTRGFTLIELMITLAVAAILLTVAVPGFRTAIQNNRVTTQSNDVLTALTLARSEALKRGIQVSVCSSNDQTDCDGAPGTDWANGWIVFVDQNTNGTFEDDGDATVCEVDAANLPAEDCLLRVWDALAGSPALTATSANVQFLPTGLANAAITLTLTPNDCEGNQERILAVSAIGRGRISEDPCF